MKKLILTLLIISVMTGIVYSQVITTLPGGMGLTDWESPQSAATQGRMRSNSDNFIRADAFTGVSFDKFFAMTSYASTGRAQLGYATKISNIYMAIAYGGSFWTGYTPNNYNEMYRSDWPGGAKTVPVYNNLNFAASSPENRMALLIGLPDMNMGFRFAFFTSYDSISNKEFVSGADLYKSFNSARGNITPQLAWSMTKDLTPKGIRPNLSLDLGFMKNYEKYDKYLNDGTTNTTGVDVRNSQNYFQPVLSAGLGGYTLFRNEGGFRLSADLDYNLISRFYRNEYSYKDAAGKYQTSTIKGVVNGGTFREYSYFQNSFTPSISGQWSTGPLATRFQFRMPLYLGSEKSTEMNLEAGKTSGDLVKEGADSKTTIVNFAPQLRLAAQWKIISSLTLNFGGRISISSLQRETSKGETFSQGIKNDNSSFKNITSTFGSTGNTLTAGVTFNPFSNLSFEAACGVVSPNTVSVFDPSGLFRFANILVSLKF